MVASKFSLYQLRYLFTVEICNLWSCFIQKRFVSFLVASLAWTNFKRIFARKWGWWAWLACKQKNSLLPPFMNAAYVFLVFQDVTAALACMTEALWAKRGERDISLGARHEREAREEGKRKIKLYLNWALNLPGLIVKENIVKRRNNSGFFFVFFLNLGCG